EITYRPSPLGHSLAGRLLAMQGRDGFFTNLHDGDGEQTTTESRLAATATVLRGLFTWTAQLHANGLPADASIVSAIDAGLNAIAQLFAGTKDMNTDAVGWAIVLWQLGDVEAFRARVNVAQLLSMLNDVATDIVEDELCRYAHAMAA